MRLTRKLRDARLAIARDVIDRSVVGSYRLTPGTYCKGPPSPDFAAIAREGGDLQPHVDGVAYRCDVCLLGGLFFSLVRLHDAVPVRCVIGPSGGVAPGRGYIARTLNRFFSDEEVEVFEAVFEGWSLDEDLPGTPKGAPKAFHDVARAFAEELYGDERSYVSRVIAAAVMLNLIDNDAELRLVQPPDVAALCEMFVLTPAS